ncbi:MAG: histidine kinase [Chitinophagaceae bacterium]
MKPFLPALFFLITTISAAGQLQNAPVLTHISEANGLSENIVYTVFEDSRQLVWIGTADGLNLMDGSTITIFKNVAGDSSSIAGNSITCITEDSSHNVWIGMGGTGLSRYNRRTGKFKNYLPPMGPCGGTNFINAMLPDKDHNLWCATGGGLVFFDTRKERFIIYAINPNDGSALESANNQLQIVGSDKAFWVCTNNGVYRFSLVTHEFLVEIDRSGDPLYDAYMCLHQSRDGHLWIGTWSKGLKEYDPVSKKLVSYTNLPDAPSNVVRIENIRTADGTSLLLLNGRLQYFDPVAHVFGMLGKPLQMVETPEVKPCHTSADGWVWLASSNGLYLMSPARQQICHHFFTSELTTQSVNFFEWNKKLVFGGQNQDFLTAFTDSFEVAATYSQVRLDHHNSTHAKSTALLGIQKAAEANCVWLATSEGICWLNLETHASRWFVHKNHDSTSLPRNFIADIFLDKSGKLWVFPWREGIWQMDKNTGRCTQLLRGLIKEGNGIRGMLISDAVEDARGNIWMADLDEGIVRYDGASGQFTKPFEKLFGSLSHTARIIEKEGWFCAIVNRTLFAWNPLTLQNWQKRLPPEMDKEMYDFTIDKAGNWWIGTHAGLVAWKQLQGTFQRFTVADGLLDNNMDGNLFCRADGSVLHAVARSITSFRPEQLLQGAVKKPTQLLSGVWVNGVKLDMADTDAGIDLDYKSNNLVFRWSVTDYTNPFANQYYYRLTSADTTWHYAGNKGELQLASLSPGDYHLELLGKSSNGTNAANSLQVHFKVHPPFWKTWWFRVLSVIALALLIWWFVTKRIRAIRKETAVKQLMAEAEMKALRAQMNPHFIFNSLNSIQECIVMKNTDGAYTYLSKFSKLVRRILENSGKQFVPLLEETQLLQWYVELEQLRFNEPIVFTMDIDPGIDRQETMIPSMILQPYIENALWHGLAQKAGEKKLSVVFARINNRLVCTIQDNGIGRQQSAAINQQYKPNKQSMGMEITKERLNLISEQAKVEIEDLIDETGNAAGTKVVVHLPELLTDA